MSWIELTIHCSDKDSEYIEPIANELGALAVTMQDLHDNPVLEPGVGETPLWPEITLTALFEASVDIDAIAQQLRAHCGSKIRHLQVSTLADQQWERSWMAQFKPMCFGGRLWICPSWSEPPEPGAVVLHMDPGLAFGTGTHATTALCLEKLAALKLRDMQILDFGCGSGILAIAALKLGAKSAVCIDNDPQALVATESNRVANNIPAAAVSCAEKLIHSDPSFDLVIANILAEPLIEYAASLSAQLRPGGLLLLSGVLEEQVESVRAAYSSQIEFSSPIIKDGWALLVGVRH